MNLYLGLFLILAAASVAEYRWPERSKVLYGSCWLLTTACVCLRFGQGTDYASYQAIYETIPAVIDLSKGYICGFYPEIGWRLLCGAFKAAGLSFQVMVTVLGLAEMLLLHRFLNRFVRWKTAGLFLSFPVLIYVYLISGLRQGLAMCVLLGIALPFLVEKRWIPYVISVLLAASFHKVGSSWLILVSVSFLPMWSMEVLTGLSIAGGLILQAGPVKQLIVYLLPIYHVKQFLLEGSPSLFAAGERLISFAVLMALYLYQKKKEETDDVTEHLMKVYLCGVCFYMLMVGNAYYASRYAVVFKIVECVLAVRMLELHGKMERAAALFFLCLTLLMGVKNMNASIGEGGYARDQVNVLTFPYVSVFDRDRINEYYDYNAKVKKLYDYNIEDQQLWMIEE